MNQLDGYIFVNYQLAIKHL